MSPEPSEALKDTGLTHGPLLDRGGPCLSVNLPAKQSRRPEGQATQRGHCDYDRVSIRFLLLLLPVTDGTYMARATQHSSNTTGLGTGDMDSGLSSVTP